MSSTGVDGLPRHAAWFETPAARAPHHEGCGGVDGGGGADGACARRRGGSLIRPFGPASAGGEGERPSSGPLVHLLPGGEGRGPHPPPLCGGTFSRGEKDGGGEMEGDWDRHAEGPLAQRCRASPLPSGEGQGEGRMAGLSGGWRRVMRGSASAGCPRGERGRWVGNRATRAAVDPRTPWEGPAGWNPRRDHLAARSVSPDRRGHRIRIPRPDGRPEPRGWPAPLARMGAAPPMRTGGRCHAHMRMSRKIFFSRSHCICP